MVDLQPIVRLEHIVIPNLIRHTQPPKKCFEGIWATYGNILSNSFKFCQPLSLASRETEKVQKTPFANDVVSTVITLNVVLPCTEPMRCEGLRNGSAGRKNVQAMKIARASKKLKET